MGAGLSTAAKATENAPYPTGTAPPPDSTSTVKFTTLGSRRISDLGVFRRWPPPVSDKPIVDRQHEAPGRPVIGPTFTATANEATQAASLREPDP